MAIKPSVPGLLIYAAMLLCLAAFAAHKSEQAKPGRIMAGLAFAFTLAAFLWQWRQAGHAPMQSMFEVFLTLGAAVYPLSLFWRRVLKAQGEMTDALITFVILFPAGFVFRSEPQRLPPALQSPLFIPHVMVYLLAYVLLFKAGLMALRHLTATTEMPEQEEASFRLVRLGFPLLTLGLILGAWWGRLAWGDYWNWDPKELWSLATWLVFLAYLHVRGLLGARYARLNSTFAVLGAVCVILTLLWVNLAGRMFPGMHTYATQ